MTKEAQETQVLLPDVIKGMYRYLKSGHLEYSVG